MPYQDHRRLTLSAIALLQKTIRGGTPRQAMPSPAPRLQRSSPRLNAGLLLTAAAAATFLAPAQAAPPATVDSTKAPDRCPALLPKDQSFFEPVRLNPQEVPAKNARGCLSPGDAIYGPDGCPTRLCPQPRPFAL